MSMLKYFIVTMIVLTFASGCVPTPDINTNEKRLFAAEVTYNETLQAVKKNIHRMSITQKSQVRMILIEGKSALDLARDALSFGSLLDFETSVSTVNSSVSALRVILEELEKKEVTGEFSIKSYNFA